MAQFNSKKEITSDVVSEEIMIESTDVMTGDKNQSRFLLYQLKTSIAHAKRIDIIVAFLRESGVRMILEDIREAIDRGVKVRILTGNYLNITQPSALYLVKKELGDLVDLRFYNDKKRSFHPKAYLFHYEHSSEIYIGSSNLSKSALTSGVEWNYRFSSVFDAKNFKKFHVTFEELFLDHSIVIDDEQLQLYSKSWHKPTITKELERYDEIDENKNVLYAPFPRGVQIEALYALEESRAEGATRGLVQAATGERVIIVTGCINALVSRVSGTLIKNNSCIA